jgi:TRAP-type C4-dicarboxylate transport system substrate-binding protein
MRIKLWFSIVLSLILLVGLTSSALSADTIKLKFAYSAPDISPMGKAWEWWGEELEKQTKGKIEVEYYPFGSLFRSKSAVDNILKGTADISEMSIKQTAYQYPLLSVTLVPSVRWPNTVEGMEEGGLAVMKLIDEFPSIQKEVRSFKVLSVLMMEDFYLYTKKKVTKPSDLKGMNIGSGGSQAAFVRGQGGGAVSIITPKAYMNLKTGVIDGIITVWGAVGGFKFWEVTNYGLEVPMGRSAIPVIMNLESWNAIPKDIQKLMMELGEKSSLMGAKGLLGTTLTGIAGWKKAGKAIHTPSKEELAVWMRAFQPFEKAWLDNAVKKGHKDAPAILKRWKEMAAAAWK